MINLPQELSLHVSTDELLAAIEILKAHGGFIGRPTS
jgi:hypothetical protein